MKTKRQMSFRDEIRMVLIVNTLMPCIISLVVLVLGFTMFGIWQIARQNEQAVERDSVMLSGLFQRYVEECGQLSRDMNLPAVKNSPTRQAEMASRVYHFLNSQEIRGDFYLFDIDRSCIFSTLGDPVTSHFISNYLSWGEEAQEPAGNSELAFVYDVRLGEASAPAWLVSCPTGRGTVTGYCSFVLPAGRLKLDPDGQERFEVVVNQFNRVLGERNSRFVDDRGKLHEELRGRKGLLRFRDRWYYVSCGQVQKESIWLYSFDDCNAFIQTCVVSLALVCALALVITVTIYWSAGNVAYKKTLIIYELIDALDQVEKGNLNVTLDIKTGDEFEHIGNSFNIMLGSIRHLLIRHEALARENLAATMQILKSQFNPHFLFNTLESIRWMIRTSPREAEGMLVSLSRLLRYSIQSGSEPVRLDEELLFAEQYLQIMLRRFQDRLEYRINVPEAYKGLKVPRMILQPLVENSIKYGFGDRLTHITVEIAASLQGEDLYLRVCDNGVGIPPDLLRRLRENLKQEQNELNTIGLYNVSRRLQLIYGPKYGLTIESGEKGTTVTLVLPAAG